MRFIHNDPKLKDRRRSLRNNSTPEEIILWNHLKSSKLGKPFRRQFGIGPYVADFYCHKLKLIIELDGEYHNSEQQKDYDAERDRFMERGDYTVLRFSNADVRLNLEKILTEICDTIQRLD